MVSRKRKTMESPLEQASHWLEFQNRIKEIEPRRCTTWVDITEVPGQGGVAQTVHWRDVLSSGVSPELEALRLRDPDHFSVGGLHQSVKAWDNVLEGHPLAEGIGRWIRDKVRILEFARPFSGVYKRVKYASDMPPPKQFPNHTSCRKFFEFISQEIMLRVTTGAFRVWGKVGVDNPPYLVLPLTVEPSKPILCIDARFLNLWMRDMPFSLDKLVDVPRIYISGLVYYQV